MRISLISRGFLTVVKLIAFLYTGFLVLLGEALNSLVDLLVTGSLIAGRRLGERGGDREHPFGHRRVNSIVSLIAAVTFITITSFQLVREAVPRLIEPVRSFGDPNIAIYILGFSFLVNLVPLILLLPRESQQELPLKTELYDTINDEISILAALAGVWFVSRGFYLGDPIATLVIAAIIASSGVMLIRENTELLLGRSPDDDFYEEAKRIITSIDGVRGVHDMIAEYLGSNVIHMDFDLELDPEMPLWESDQIVQAVKERLKGVDTKTITTSIHPCAHRGEERKLVGQGEEPL
ncbi:MAG: cation diffusion facilitator family transporter [Candidatus Bipolaricaulia bacterium]